MTRGSSISMAGCWLQVLLVSVCWVVITPSQGDFSIAAFNVRIFGTSKADKVDVMKTLVKVSKQVTRYTNNDITMKKIILFTLLTCLSIVP